jgi:phosphonoacetaldehyde hydrolase
MTSNTNGIAAVVFDWAGTMIDFGCVAPVDAMKTVFSAQGIAITDADARQDMGRAKRDHVRGILSIETVRRQWLARHGRDFTEDDVGRIHDALEPVMVEATATYSELIPGAAALVQALQGKGIRIGSSTGYTRTMMQEILPRAAAQGYAPDYVVCSGETLEGRPSPLPMWKNMVELAAWPARRCVKVDDAEVGIREGRNAGVWTIGIAASGNGVGLGLADWQALSAQEQRARADAAAAPLKALGAHYVIDTVADLLPLLAEIEQRIAAGDNP